MATKKPKQAKKTLKHSKKLQPTKTLIRPPISWSGAAGGDD
jgi:hypothetical protein